MKKSLLLSFCLLCVSGLSACNTSSGRNYSNDAPFIEDDVAIIDATQPQQPMCGVNGISCNDTALVNYTKTEADYRQYGERTKRDHLYTQAGTGNNLTATIRPGVENNVVTPSKEKITQTKQENIKKHLADDGAFSETGYLNFETEEPQIETEEVEKVANQVAPKEEKIEIGRADNIKTSFDTITKTTKKTVIKTVTEEDGTIYEIVCEDEACTEVKKIKQTVTDEDTNSKYEIICEDDCEEIMAASADDDIITSEFTEESFDIADYIEEDIDTEIEFDEVGKKEQVTADLNIEEVKIADDTILTWEAEEGENLRELLTKWSAMSGWKLLWNTNRNYVLSAGVMFKGKFADVSSALIRAFARARPAPIATYYKGNRVIVVETMENENAY